MNGIEERKITSLRQVPVGSSVEGLVVGEHGIIAIAEVEREGIGGISKRRWQFQCPHCERSFEAIAANVVSGNTKSCGCLITKRPTNTCTDHAQKSYLRLLHLGLVYSDDLCEEWLDQDQFISDVISEAGNRQSSDQVLSKLQKQDIYTSGNICWR